MEGLNIKIETVYRDNDGRYLIIQTRIRMNHLILVNCYYKPKEEGAQISLLSKIKKIIQNLETEEGETSRKKENL